MNQFYKSCQLTYRYNIVAVNTCSFYVDFVDNRQDGYIVAFNYSYGKAALSSTSTTQCYTSAFECRPQGFLRDKYSMISNQFGPFDFNGEQVRKDATSHL